MSTESFESVVNESFEIAKAKLRITFEGKLFEKLLSDLQAAHDREIRDTAQQQYHRGYEDGRHSMDAEHRAVVMRLRALPMNRVEYNANLYDIIEAVCGTNKAGDVDLRDKLIDLMGGVSDENVHVVGLYCDDGCMGDVSNGEDTGRTHDSPSNRDRNHMAVREGLDTVIGDSDDTCCRAGGGACDAAGCDCAGEQKEMSDDCADCDTLGPDACGHAVGCDFHEMEVSDGRVADDSSADSRGRTGSELVHMDGLVTYDVLGNERRKAVCELRKMTIDSDYHSNYQRIALAIGTVYDGESFASECVRDRLIHLLGGDQPSGIDVLNGADLSKMSVDAMSKRAMDANGTCQDNNGTCPNDVPTSSITDELREWASANTIKDMVLTTYPEQHAVHGTLEQLIAIADRIDEQFDRICWQHEAVLQSTIDSMCEEQDRLQERLRTAELGCDANHRLAEANARWCDELLDLLRDARDEYKTLDQASAETSVNFNAMRDRVWGLEAERDELQAKLDELEKFDPDTSLAAFGDDNDELRRLLSRSAKLLEIAEHDRDTNYAYWMDCKDKVVHANITIDELQAKLDAITAALNG